MKYATKTALTAMLMAPLLMAIGAMLLMVNGRPANVLAQTTQEATATPATVDVTTTEAALQVTPTLTGTIFDNAFFVLSYAVRPEDFVTCIDNPYFPLIPGTIYTYETETENGLETNTSTVTNQIKQVMGITATVVHDSVSLEGELKEDTFDWYAQDKRGNVWYLGEKTAEYENGKIVSTEGSWQAGIDGAIPGIIMLADPFVGDLYRQEYLKDKAVDMAAVLSKSESLSVPFGDFDHVLMTADVNPLSGEQAHKFYAAGMGTVAELVVDGSEHTQLIAISHDSTIQSHPNGCGKGINLNNGTKVIVDAGDAALLAPESDAGEQADSDEGESEEGDKMDDDSDAADEGEAEDTMTERETERGADIEDGAANCTR